MHLTAIIGLCSFTVISVSLIRRNTSVMVRCVWLPFAIMRTSGAILVAHGVPSELMGVTQTPTVWVEPHNSFYGILKDNLLLLC